MEHQEMELPGTKLIPCHLGALCPFLHVAGPNKHRSICPYFLKGTCKYGSNCALVHKYPTLNSQELKELTPLNINVETTPRPTTTWTFADLRKKYSDAEKNPELYESVSQAVDVSQATISQEEEEEEKLVRKRNLPVSSKGIELKVKRPLHH
jgi:hypothetical protein